MFLVWLDDRHSPFYISNRVGKGGGIFRIYKLRSMVKNADKSGVSSTAEDDNRITTVGHLIRKFKLDELPQLWNVFKGDMSLVWPRPNTEAGTDFYTSAEKKILNVRPGITDFSSIVFSDEGNILAGSDDPDLKYNQVIRPWKSRLAIFYIDHSSFVIDIKILFIKILLRKILQEPNIIWNKLLSWLFIQQKDFGKAFIQEKAIFNRQPESLNRIVELSNIAINEKDFAAAKDMLNYLIITAQDLDTLLETHYNLLQIETEESTEADLDNINQK
mgnify:CR=1 FL=1